MNDKYFYSSNLRKKMDAPFEAKTRLNFCFWSDLLGFGKSFFEHQWNLPIEEKKKIYERLQMSHNIFLNHITPITETSLVLNDGLVKVARIKEETHPDLYGFYLRECILTHNDIKKAETQQQLPGPRSVLTFGEQIEYIIPDVKLDDFVYNYTKKDPNQLSKLAQTTGNPTVVYNPAPFQMNMAFSKAYTLDSLGKKHGLEGSHLYVEQSVLDFSEMLAKKLGTTITNTTNNGERTFLLEKGNDYVYWGFKFDAEIPITYKGWNTTVYRLKSFFPPDEKITEFEQEVE